MGTPAPRLRLLSAGPGVPQLFLIEHAAPGPGLRLAARRLSDELDAPCTSRSYAPPWALVAVHHDAVGVDIERVTSWTPAQARSMLTPAEAAHLPADDRAVTSIWSGKEALAKALGDARDYDPRRLGSPGTWPGGAAGRWRARPLDLPDGHVGWVCWSHGTDPAG